LEGQVLTASPAYPSDENSMQEKTSCVVQDAGFRISILRLHVNYIIWKNNLPAATAKG
jgi:hypothetical protein